ncbi:DUF4232 domain-containing protein [Streptacidiphilus sp. N1-3]|uniref:DUF4232 domain-containing protein n=1 Tax=Streptacidiphilus alkalitolerans TaxID=3342712 RepID=A0ABV6WVB2_9ACTN
MNASRSIPLALLAAATAVLATACGPTSTTGATGAGSGTAAPGASAPVAGSGSASAPAPASAPAAVSARPAASRSAAPTPPGGKAPAAGGNAGSDSYAWKHPCDPGQVSIQVEYQHGIGDTRRIIVATNHGSAACGLSYYPAVAIADSGSIGSTSHPARFATPKVPGGLGGAPYTPIHAGSSLYAVLDLDPGHTTSGAVRGYDELDVKAADFMPDAATTNHPVKAQPGNSGNPYVKAPVLSLYRSSIADAVAQVGNLADFE